MFHNSISSTVLNRSRAFRPRAIICLNLPFPASFYLIPIFRKNEATCHSGTQNPPEKKNPARPKSNPLSSRAPSRTTRATEPSKNPHGATFSSPFPQNEPKCHFGHKSPIHPNPVFINFNPTTL